MSAELLHFPAPPDPRGTIRPARFGSAFPAIRRYRLVDLAAALALDTLDRRAQIDRLRGLHHAAGLPLPINPRLRAGRLCTGAASICSASLWDAAAIDAWLHRPGPSAPAVSAPTPRAVPAGLRDQMARRAQQLAGAHTA